MASNTSARNRVLLLQMVEDFGDDESKNDGEFRYHKLRDSKLVKQRYHFNPACECPRPSRVRLRQPGYTSAPEVLVELCSKIAKPDGSLIRFSKQDEKNARDAIQRMAERGLRT